jgi:tagatose-1,6-bisphosphate aldolase non-catalytic subunit AgaZ/GatZ
MPSAAYSKFNDYVEQESKAVHNWAAHTFKVALSNTAPSASNTVLADITQIATSGGYVGGAGGGFTLDSVTLTETSGTAKLSIADEVITATGGSIGPFRYAIVYNDSATSPADALVNSYDYGSSITLADGESLTIDFDAAAGVWTKT